MLPPKGSSQSGNTALVFCWIVTISYYRLVPAMDMQSITSACADSNFHMSFFYIILATSGSSLDSCRPQVSFVILQLNLNQFRSLWLEITAKNFSSARKSAEGISLPYHFSRLTFFFPITATLDLLSSSLNIPFLQFQMFRGWTFLL